MSKNYIDHEFEVKIKDGIIEKNREWQWFFDYIQLNFTLNDINSWDEFEESFKRISDIYTYLHSIQELDPLPVSINNIIIKDILSIANFFYQQSDFKNTQEIIESNFGKLALFISWITVLQNNSNNSQSIYDKSVLYYKNWYLLNDLSDLRKNREIIKNYLNSLDIKGLNEIKEVLFSNLDNKFCLTTINFLSPEFSVLINHDTFNFSLMNKKKYLPWQDYYIYEMFNVKIENLSLIPIFQSSKGTNPDISNWTLETLEKMEEYYKTHKEALFIIETIKLILYDKIPSIETINKHFELIVSYLNKTSEKELNLNCSSLEVIKYIYLKKVEGVISKHEVYINFINKIHSLKEIKNLEYLVENKIPLSPNQKNILNNYYNTQFTEIDNLKNENEFLYYLKSINNAKKINTEYLKKVNSKFNYYLESKINYVLFYSYMIFLFKVLEQNTITDKEYTNNLIINLYELWSQKYFYISYKKLNQNITQLEIPNSEIEEFNKLTFENPYFFAKNCISKEVEDFINDMESCSAAPLSVFTSKYIINKHFPYLEKRITNRKNNEFDSILNKIIEEVKKKYGYKFLNIFDTEVYINNFYNYTYEKIQFFSSIFYKEKEVYELLKKMLPTYLLLELNNNLWIAHITQLFPILEIKIRELGILYNVVPFKCKEEDFIEFKEPSSILKQILEKIYNENFFCDLLFVYNCMYNKNSLNIRNKCIHGFDYYKEEELLFPFKITILSLYMIIHRINLICSMNA